MNDERRAKLRDVRRSLMGIRDKIEAIIEEEDEARDNTPESLQYSERYETSEENSAAMEEAMDSVDNAIRAIEEVI